MWLPFLVHTPVVSVKKKNPEYRHFTCTVAKIVGQFFSVFREHFQAICFCKKMFFCYSKECSKGNRGSICVAEQHRLMRTYYNKLPLGAGWAAGLAAHAELRAAVLGRLWPQGADPGLYGQGHLTSRGTARGLPPCTATHTALPKLSALGVLPGSQD